MSNSSASPPPSPPSPSQDSLDVNPLRRLWWGLGAAAVVLLAIYLFAPRGKTGPGTTKAAAKAEWDDARCDRVLADAYRGLAPDRLGISSSEDTILRDLNQWGERCGEKNAVRTATDGLADLLSRDALGDATSERFQRRDAQHIRSALLCQQIVERVAPKKAPDSERARVLFQYLMRQVPLRPAGFPDPPQFTPFDCLLYGEGTALERAWLFVEVLRQLPIDAVLLTTEDDKEGAFPLVGVLSPEEGCLLFDTGLGLPVPADLATDDAWLVSKVADYKGAVDRPELLRQLDAEGLPYVWTSERLKTAKVWLVGSSSWWSPRMANLQFQLQPIVRVTLSEPLVSPGKDQKGYFDRVAEFRGGAFERSRIAVWPVPEERFLASADVPKSPYWAALQRVFNGPAVIQLQKVGNQQQEVQALSNRPLKLIRVWQLEEREETLRGYLAIRNAPAQIASPENNAAAQFATYWVGLSQFEAGSLQSAQETLVDYVRIHQLPDGGTAAIRAEPAWLLIAETLAMQKDPRALESLKKIQNPAQPLRNEILFRHWSRLLKPAEGGGAGKSAAE